MKKKRPWFWLCPKRWFLGKIWGKIDKKSEHAIFESFEKKNLGFTFEGKTKNFFFFFEKNFYFFVWR